jgi:hypothetical protein
MRTRANACAVCGRAHAHACVRARPHTHACACVHTHRTVHALRRSQREQRRHHRIVLLLSRAVHVVAPVNIQPLSAMQVQQFGCRAGCEWMQASPSSERAHDPTRAIYPACTQVHAFTPSGAQTLRRASIRAVRTACASAQRCTAHQQSTSPTPGRAL